MLYSLDASTINLCLSVFPWTKFRTTKNAIKLHVGFWILDFELDLTNTIYALDSTTKDLCLSAVSMCAMSQHQGGGEDA